MGKNMGQIGRDRATLHRAHLKDFREYLEHEGGYIFPEPTAHEYEVLRVRKYNRSGDEPDMFFYRRAHTDHITVPSEMVRVVKKFLRHRKHIKRQRQTVNLEMVVDND